MKTGIIAGVMTVTWMVASAWAQTDLQEKYGVRSPVTAQHIAKGIAATEGKRLQEALKELDAALKLEPNSDMALYWKACALCDSGDLDAAETIYKRLAEVGPNGALPNNVFSALNLGVMLVQLKRHDEAAYWLTKVLLNDELDRGEIRWKALYNLAMNAAEANQPLSAALAMYLAVEANPHDISEGDVKRLLQKASQAEVGRVLSLSPKPAAAAQRTAREAPCKLSPAALAGDAIAEKVTDLLVDPAGAYVVAICKDQSHYYVISTGESLRARKVPAGGHVLCASLAGGRLYLALALWPPVLAETEVETGRVVQTYGLGSFPGSIAAFPSRNVVFYACRGEVWLLHLVGGWRQSLQLPGQVVAGDADQRFLYAYVRDYKENTVVTRTVQIEGRPITLGMIPTGTNQTTLFKYLVGPQRLHLAEARLNAAASAGALVVSPDGRWVSVVGRDGWRPPGDARGGVSKVAVLAAEDLGQVQMVVNADQPHDPYTPRRFHALAHNPFTNQVAAVREDKAVVFDLAREKLLAELPGSFPGTVAWSGTGEHLLLDKGTGLAVYSNEMTAKEREQANGSMARYRALAERGTTRPAPVAATGSSRPPLPVIPPPGASPVLAADKVYERSIPGTVLIRCGTSSGTGVCVSQPGLIVTNYHIVSEARAIQVFPYVLEKGKVRRGEAVWARLEYGSPEEDLAILRCPLSPSLAPLPVAATAPKAGDKVFAMGNPGVDEKVLDLTFSNGIVSSPARRLEGRDYLQHTAPINPGNSGGPLLNESGQVVGIVTLKASMEKVGFAIPASTVRAFFDRAAADSRRPKPSTSQPADLVPGVDIPFTVDEPYFDKLGPRIVNRNDCDGDGLPDDWEMRSFGTLKYNGRNHADAPRIDLPRK